MLFNSFTYLFCFLPLAVVLYLLLNSRHLNIAATLWLVTASLFFYAFWKVSFLPIILSSILVNYVIGKILSVRSETTILSGRNRNHISKIFFTVGILFNIGLLAYFKYADFFISNVNTLFGTLIPHPHITLPLGISFFSFQQITYIVDSYHGQTKEYSFLNYALFVSFFPQLIAGPIVHHKEMMPQFASVRNKNPNWNNIYTGLFFLGIGLFKKVAVADTFAVWVNEGFSDPGALTFLTAWKTSLSYTIQLYFDFSAYTDMAIGSARLVNIRIPQNFNSPYFSLDIKDFWRRWHITLGRFLREYIYIPMGGNRNGRVRTYVNLFVTFLIGGIWHGAGWTFIFWGALHGTALCIYRLWAKMGLRMPKMAAWLTTFLFVNAAWVFFRADSFQTALTILRIMTDITSLDIQAFNLDYLLDFEAINLFGWGIIFAYVLQDIFFKNTQAWAANLSPKLGWTMGAATAFVTGIIFMMNTNRFSEFIYFQF